MKLFRRIEDLKQKPIDSKNLKTYREVLSAYNENIHADEIDLPYLSKFLELLGKNKKVLDFGCGAGGLTSKLQKDGYEITGSDISDDFLALARKSHPENNFVKGDSEGLVNSGLTFDSIISAYSLIHTQAGLSQYVLSDFNKLLNKDGYLFLSLQENPRTEDGKHYTQDQSGEYSIPYKPELKLWLKLFNSGDMENILRMEGFKVVNIEFRNPVANEFPFRKMFITAQKTKDELPVLSSYEEEHSKYRKA